MNRVADLLLLRPVFTVTTLRLVWWLVLIKYGFDALSLVFAARYNLPATVYQWVTAPLLFLPLVVHLLLIRVLLELAIAAVKDKAHDAMGDTPR